MSNEGDVSPMEVSPKNAIPRSGAIYAAALPAKAGYRAGAESDCSKGCAQMHVLQCSMDEEDVEEKSLMPPPSRVNAQNHDAKQQPTSAPLLMPSTANKADETNQSLPLPSEEVPIVLADGAIVLTAEEKLLFSALQAAAQFHFETHETAEFSSSPSASEASSTTASRVGSTVDLKARKEEEELQAKMMKNLLPIAIETNLEKRSTAMEGENRQAKQQKKIKKRPRLNIRVAGGWVRDKLLGLESDDIDVALDEASGLQFAHMLRDYLEYVEEQVKLHSALTEEVNEKVNKDGSNDIVKRDCHHASQGSLIKHIPSDVHQHHRHHKHKYKIGVIAANPNQSKHLETATMKIFGLGVDFVNLRAEEQYLPNSRIPAVKHFGTPYEDAMRRDFTINSLFYNIQTRCVEDYSHRGINDLKRGVMVTPLSPFTTFHDDPLRVLRAIRFTVRFDFELAEELRLAAQSRRIHESLICKVSRERVGTELEGMLTGKAAKPLKALQLISELGLSDSVFHIGEKEEVLVYGSLCISPSLIQNKQHHAPDIKLHDHDYGKTKDRASYRHLGWEEAKARTNLVGGVLSHFNNTDFLPHNASAITTILDERLFLLSAYLSPFKDLMWKDPKKEKNHRVATMSMVKDGIKFKNGDVNDLDCILSKLDSFQRLLRKFSSNDDDDLSRCVSRLEVGLLLREAKHLWVACLLLSAIAESRMSSNVKDGNSSKGSAASNQFKACERLYIFVAKEHLDCCWKRQPLLNGKAIMKALDLGKRGGPLVGILIDEQWKWMLQNPHGTKDECEEYLKSSLSGVEGRISK